MKGSVIRPFALVRASRKTKLAVVVGLALFFSLVSEDGLRAAPPAPFDLRLAKEFSDTSRHLPLEQVVVEGQPRGAGLRFRVFDGRGQLYVDRAAVTSGFRFRVRGPLGLHRAEWLRGNRVVASRSFQVDVETEITCDDASFCGELARLPAQLGALGSTAFVDGRAVRTFSNDLRESRFAASAARYFEPALTAFPEVFLDRQKANGLLLSSMHPDTQFDPYSRTFPGAHLARDMYGEGYTDRSQDARWVFERLPSQADVEPLMVSWVHDVWQANGDDAWMQQALPRLEKALTYLQKDPLRWSNEHGLVKRGYTLDVWSFQNPIITRIHPRGAVNRAGWFDGYWIDRDTPMGITHGDNTALYEAATLLARMHAHLGSHTQAAKWTAVAEQVRARLNELLWNGTFYCHHLRLWEHEARQEIDANESRQLSMSNPLAIVRGAATHAQAVAIIGEYQRRWDKRRGEVLAEWSTMDPPFRSGFGPHAPGEAGNGAVSPIVAAPLAEAAFEHGAEAYGADILRRLLRLQNKHGALHGFYYPTTRQPSWETETFSPVDLRTVANRHLRGDRPIGFIEHPDNDLRSFPVGRQTFLGKPFDVIDPKENGGRAAVVLWGAGSPGPRETTVAGIGKKAKSLYFLHSAGNIGRQARVGEYIINYADGSKVRIPLVVGRNISSWWSDGDAGEWRVAWRGKNPHVSVISMGVWGWDNRQPDKTIDSITIRASGQGRVQLLGITLSSGPVQYDRGEVAGGAPQAWATAASYAAAAHGLAGVIDRAQVFEHVAISPRWLAAGQDRAAVALRYPSSQGYVAYRFEHRPGDKTIAIAFSGSGRRFDFHVLLPPGQKPRQVSLDGKPLRFRSETIEASVYANFSLEALHAGDLEIAY